jgi:hypothetical protein
MVLVGIAKTSTIFNACALVAAVGATWSCKGDAGAPVLGAAVAVVAITPGTAQVAIGRTVELSAAAFDSVGNVLEGRDLTWSTADAGVATVIDGVVTGVAEGSTQITAETGGVSGTATVTVVGAAVDSVVVVPARSDLRVGQSVLLVATLLDSAGNVLTNRPVTWSSSDSTIATVDANGLVATLQVGTVTITATSEGESGTSTVSATTSSGPCSSVLSNVSLPLCDGVYSQDVSPTTFPANAVIQAQNPGSVRFTGAFEAGDNQVFRGIVIMNSGQKLLGSRTVYEDMSFVGGPACGNGVNTLSGSFVTIRRSAFYGRGGRYLFLPWHVSNVTLDDVIFRTDGGWGEGGSGCNEFEPNAVLNDYDSPGFVCLGCIVFDGIVTAGSESETLGGLGVNCHLSTSGALFDNNVIVNSAGGFWADGQGTCDTVIIRNSIAVNSSEWGVKRNVQGTTTVIRFTTNANCGAFKGAITLIESAIGGLNSGCGGSTSGQGWTVQLDTTFLNSPRWRREMCDDAGVTRGWCATSLSLSDYLKTFF